MGCKIQHILWHRQWENTRTHASRLAATCCTLFCTHCTAINMKVYDTKERDVLFVSGHKFSLTMVVRRIMQLVDNNLNGLRFNLKQFSPIS